MPFEPAPSRWRPGPGHMARLLFGLFVFGAGEAMLVASDLGNSPWTVLGQGFARRTGVSVGSATVMVSLLVLLAWLPLRQRPGLGTVLNALLVGVGLDATLALLPGHASLGTRVCMVPAGIALVAIGSGFYLTTGLGPGPRDGLMTGLHRLTGLSLRVVRAAIEASAVAAGYLLGGTVGAGTVAFAALIGPAVQAAVHLAGGRDTARL